MDWITLYIVATILILPSLIYGTYAQNAVHSTFERYSKEASNCNLSASELCEMLLEKAGIDDVDVELINGKLTDCYDSKHKVVKLSESTYNSISVASLGVASHEIGHAIQDHNKSFLFRLRIFLVPILNFASRAFIPLILLGSILGFTFGIPVVGYWVTMGSLILYGGSTLFSLLTLPLEFDASKKALKMLKDLNIMSETELEKTKKVLSCAAQTYVASFLTSLVYFLRFLSYAMIFARDRD